MPWWDCCTCNEVSDNNISVLDFNHLALEEVPDHIFQFERTLEELYLDSNHIGELPRQLFHCHGLKYLDLHDNELTAIPAAISSLEHLEWLDLSKNSVSALPLNIKSCSNLYHLNISLNPIEKIGDPITSMLGLTELYLNDTYLEFLPANFGRLVNLRILELRENALITLPKSMNRLESLTRLDIGQNEFTELPEVVSHLVNLTELWMDSNQIRRLPTNIGQLRKLIHIDAGNNRLTSLPKHIGYWTKVVELCLNKNELIELPPTIGNIKNMVSLKVEENRLRALPDSICKLNSLEELMLIQNSISVLPESIGLLRKLQVLTIDKNVLTALPIEIGSCVSLRVLSLRSNCVTRIPAELGQLSNLRVLNLVDNDLRELPVSLLKLNKLAALWLSNNQSQPLMPLQQDYNPETRQTFLTCLLLPQRDLTVTDLTVDTVSEDNNENSANGNNANNDGDTNPSSIRRHIYFAPEPRGGAIPQKLSRAPTPYPKELRALARHARSMQRGLSLISSETIAEIPPSPIPESSNMVMNTDNELQKTDQIKEATTVPTSQPQMTLPIKAEPVCVTPKQTDEPVIRQARNKSTYPYRIRSPRTPENEESESSGSLIMQPNQPPPYYIAAAQSQHAEYFQNILRDKHKNVFGEVIPPPYSNSHYEQDTMSLNSVDTLNANQQQPPPPQLIQDQPRNTRIVAPTPQRVQTTYAFPTHSHAQLPPGNPYPNEFHHDSNVGLQSQLYPRNAWQEPPHYHSQSPQTQNNNRQNRWLFGNHRNPYVIQVAVRKTGNDLGFQIKSNNGIFVSEILKGGYADSLLKIGDKILNVENIYDFTKINVESANRILENSGPIINLMISRTN